MARGSGAKYLDDEEEEIPPTPASGAGAKYLEPEPEPKKSGAGQAALLGGAQGASFGFADELTGAAGALFHSAPVRALRKVTGIAAPYEGERVPATAAEAYREARDSSREDLEQSRKEHPAVAYGSELVTSLANPVKLGPKGATTLPGRVAQGAARGAAEGATFAAGASTSDTIGGTLKDTLKGGALGGATGTAGAAAGEVARKLASGRVDRLEKRILNEAAEGDPGSPPVNLANRRKLEKAEAGIVKEVVHGPDAKAVRAALQAPPGKAIEMLQPIIDGVGQRTDDGYKAFDAAGKGTVDTGEYGARLYEKLKAAKTLPEKRGIELMINDFQELVDRNDGAPLSLRDVRAHTTSIQGVHEAVLKVTPAAAGKLKGKLSAVATEAMDDTLDAAAQGDPKLIAAANAIRAENERMRSLLTLRQMKEAQLGPESTGKSLLRRGADKAGVAVGGGALGAAYSASQDPENAARNIAFGVGAGALAKGLPAITNAIDRGITTRAIQAARGNVSPSAGKLASGLSRTAAQALARLTLGQGSEEEARKLGATEADIRMSNRANERRLREQR